ncbi:hypothetical protein [Clostridium kluyveri]|uniref:Uncharacterized protein n=1 Tax=Clostridium kluyveri (strain ATCC 8527 / DSM 555 / NBRC 12016 / NCIMB 10680 / K1) TaxID=431943 RepID=A5N5M9_CLOK5|nr:hypothetical protein [Clostridium kluyveri]EDK32610.1 Hypothetical protein CKL_0556 [Clostridium kluyveri DSM 555]
MCIGPLGVLPSYQSKGIGTLQNKDGEPEHVPAKNYSSEIHRFIKSIWRGMVHKIYLKIFFILEKVLRL